MTTPDFDDRNPPSTHPPAAPGAADDSKRGGRFWNALRHAPTVLVLLAIGGVGAWGHATGWKVPKFSELRGTGGAAAQKEDWCEEHAVPESRCIKCHPELVGASIDDWCREHGTKESTCTLCHPEILTKGVAGDWCPEHGLPESSCTLCHPEIAVRGALPPNPDAPRVIAVGATTQPISAPATQQDAGTHGHEKSHDHDRHKEHDHAKGAPEHADHKGHDHGGKGHDDAKHEGHAHNHGDGHGRTAHAPTTGAASGHEHPERNPKTCQTHTLRVQFASAQSVRKAGVKLAQAVERPMAASLSATGELDYNRTRFAQVSSPLAGRAWRVEADSGSAVKQGDVLALVDAGEVGKAKAELLSALASLELKAKTAKRLRASAEQGFKTDADLQEAEAAAKEAEIRVYNARQSLINLGLSAGEEELADLSQRRNVQFMGLPQSLAASLDPKTAPASLVPVTAPFDGVVVSRGVVGGERVEPGKPLFEIADTRRMWVTVDLPVAEARRVKLGQELTFRPDGAADDAATGKIAWISTAVDEQTRTVRLRAEVDNPDGRLLAHTFGDARITVRESPTAVAVPDEAIQWEGCCHIVFVRLTDDIFQTRKVKLGAKVNGFTEVAIGLLPGEVVAAAGSHVLKSEILKSALGAGCGHAH